MSILTQDVIDGARDTWPAFVAKQHPDAVCWRFLSRYVKQLTSRVGETAPYALGTAITTIGLPTVAGSVANVLHVVHVEAVPVDTARPNVPIEILSPTASLRGTTAGLFVWINGDYLYTSGQASDWQAFSALRMHAIPVPQNLTTSQSEIVLPNDALPVLVARLAEFLAQRHVAENSKFDPSGFVAAANVAEATFVSRLESASSAQVWTMRRVRD